MKFGYFTICLTYNMQILVISGSHVSHLDSADEEELNRLLRIVVDVENLFVCVTREEDAEAKQVYFYLFKVNYLFMS